MPNGALLTEAPRREMWSREEAAALARPVAPDDLLDATIAAWTARRVAEGKCGRLPADHLPEDDIDARGLRMTITY